MKTISLIAAGLILLSGSNVFAHAAETRGFSCEVHGCKVMVRGGGFILRLQSLEVRCGSVGGGGRFSSGALGLIGIEFRKCSEQSTPFAFDCSGVKDPFGPLRTNFMGSSAIEEEGQGILLSGARLSFICGGFEEIHIEGFFLGEFRAMQCGDRARRHALRMKFIGHGREGSAPNYDVFIDDNEGEGYDFEAPWRLRFKHKIKLVC